MRALDLVPAIGKNVTMEFTNNLGDTHYSTGLLQSVSEELGGRDWNGKAWYRVTVEIERTFHRVWEDTVWSFSEVV